MKRVFSGLIAVLMILTVFASCGGGEISEIILIDKTKTVTVGKTYTIQYTVNPSNSKETLLWSSSDEEVATVENGTVKALKAGETEITVMSSKGISAVCNLTVKDVDITKVEINPSSDTIKSGNTTKLDVTLYPATANGQNIKWSSSDPSVATVSQTGLVTGQKAGTVEITATTDSGKSGSAVIKVTSKKKSKTKSNSTTYVYYTPRQIADNYSGDFVFYDSSYRRLSSGEVAVLSYDDTQRAINEIYARNGNIFSSSKWSAYFSRYSWYYPRKKISQSDCNSIEQYNLNLLIKHRNSL